MAADDPKAAVLAAWERFDEQVPGLLLRAVSGAFIVVACADGSLDDSEIEIFLDMVRDTRRFSQVDTEALEQHFRALGEAILEDLDEGRRRALEAVALVKGNYKQTALVVSAAQSAILADAKTQSAEEVALRQICEVLGLDPALY